MNGISIRSLGVYRDAGEGASPAPTPVCCLRASRLRALTRSPLKQGPRPRARSPQRRTSPTQCGRKCGHRLCGRCRQFACAPKAIAARSTPERSGSIGDANDLGANALGDLRPYRRSVDVVISAWNTSLHTLANMVRNREGSPLRISLTLCSGAGLAPGLCEVEGR